MRYFYVATAFLVGSGASLVFKSERLAPFLVPQLCILGTTISIFMGTLHLNDHLGKKKDGKERTFH